MGKKHARLWLVAGALIVAAGLIAVWPGGRATAATIPFHLEQFATGLNGLTELRSNGVEGDTRLFAVQRPGTIKIISNTGAVSATPFLNITSKVQSGGEQGLLGLAFDPNYEDNGYFYVSYVVKREDGQPNGDLVISRFTAIADTANPASEKVMLSIVHPQTVHYGGSLHFGPDGHLYISTGDGNQGDTANYAQDKSNLLGKVLRVTPDEEQPYTIPADNPYFSDPNGRDEIIHIGFRNPWRISFDRANGNLWISDVGQDVWEEVNYRAAGSGFGANFGWSCYEGPASYTPAHCGGAPASAFTFPVAQYDHAAGCSITGGYVYRGTRYPYLQGKYVYTDFCSGRFWTGTINGANFEAVQQLQEGGRYTTFGEDNAGELFVGNIGGTIYRVTSGGGPDGDPVYRFWSQKFRNAHFFTRSVAERDHLINNDNAANGGNWTYEGVAYRAMPDQCASHTSGSVHRFWSPVFLSHFYTVTEAEKNHLIANDRYGSGGNWTYEGVVYCAFETAAQGTSPIYRFWSPVYRNHFFTKSEAEKNHLIANDPNWTYEGAGFYAY